MPRACPDPAPNLLHPVECFLEAILRDHAAQSGPTGSLDYVYYLSQSLSMGDWRYREHGHLTRDETIITDVHQCARDPTLN